MSQQFKGPTAKSKWIGISLGTSAAGQTVEQLIPAYRTQAEIEFAGYLPKEIDKYLPASTDVTPATGVPAIDATSDAATVGADSLSITFTDAYAANELKGRKVIVGSSSYLITAHEAITASIAEPIYITPVVDTPIGAATPVVIAAPAVSEYCDLRVIREVTYPDTTTEKFLLIAGLQDFNAATTKAQTDKTTKESCSWTEESDGLMSGTISLTYVAMAYSAAHKVLLERQNTANQDFKVAYFDHPGDMYPKYVAEVGLTELTPAGGTQGSDVLTYSATLAIRTLPEKVEINA